MPNGVITPIGSINPMPIIKATKIMLFAKYMRSNLLAFACTCIIITSLL